MKPRLILTHSTLDAAIAAGRAAIAQGKSRAVVGKAAKVERPSSKPTKIVCGHLMVRDSVGWRFLKTKPVEAVKR